MMQKQTIRIHRIGTVTFGIVLVAGGLLFLTRLFWPDLNYEVIWHLWPVILILLGIEVLWGSRNKNYEIRDEKGELVEQSRIIYDVPAIILMVVLTFFSMIMGMIEWAYTYYGCVHF